MVGVRVRGDKASADPVVEGAMPDITCPNLSLAHWRVLERLVLGESDRQIAAALGLPLRTVTDRVAVLYTRLPLGRVANRRVAAVWYVRRGRQYRPPARADA